MNLISRIAMLYYFKSPVFNKRLRYAEKQRMAHTREKQSIETILEEAETLGLLHKECKSLILFFLSLFI